MDGMRRLDRHAWFVLACLGMAMPCAVASVQSGHRLSCQTHIAVTGDTLVALAQRHLAMPTHWRALARVNRISDPRRIPVGQALCLPLDLLKASPRPGIVLEVTGEATRQTSPATPKRSRTHIQPAAVQPPAPPSEPVAKGDAIPPGTRLQTGAHGYVTVQLPDGSILKIQADTDAQLQQSQQYEGTGFFSTIWQVLRGRVESQVTPTPDRQPRHQIKTPHATIGVRGTIFRVNTDGTSTLEETLSGTVAVRSGRAETLLQAGQGTVARQGQAPEPPRPLPPPPDVSLLLDLHERVVLKFELPALPGARAYRVQVAQDSAFQRVKGEALSATPLIRMTDLPDGDYFLRARVADARGLESADAVRTFRLNARPEPPIPLGPPHKGKVRGPSATLSWATHPDALHYRLQIARDATFQSLVHEVTALTDTQASVALQPGDYHWRVAATASGPDHGPWGDAQLLLMREPPAQPPPPQVTDTTLRFQLLAEPGQRFELQLARDAAFTTMIEEIHALESIVVAARPQEGGLIHVRYRAIDDDGFIGPYSTTQTVALPPCVRSADGHCVQGGAGYITTQP
jgi:hypothetical protein